MSKYRELYKRLNYQFRDESLLRTALSHRSSGSQNNERMEFLGDSILGFLISEKLHTDLPAANEGDLSRLRAELVRKESLSLIARELQLGSLLILGTGERKGGGANRDSILSDAFEALITAIYLDSGFTTCRDVVLPLFSNRLDSLNPAHVKDAKTRLQEFLQAQKLPLPVYTTVRADGEDHDQTFHVTCSTDVLDTPMEGSGTSKREAEQQAAERTLQEIESDR